MNKFALKTLLLKKQEELSHIGETITNTNITKDNTTELNELSQVITENNIISLIDFKKNKELKLIQTALSRIDQDDFGCCLECDGEIDEKRLEANPIASLCIECQERSERYAKSHNKRSA